MVTAANRPLQARAGKNFPPSFGLVLMNVDSFLLASSSEKVLDFDGAVLAGATNFILGVDFLLVFNNTPTPQTFNLRLEQAAGGSINVDTGVVIAPGASADIGSANFGAPYPAGTSLRLVETGGLGPVTAGGGVRCVRATTRATDSFVTNIVSATMTAPTSFDVASPAGVSAIQGGAGFVNFSPTPVTIQEYLVFPDGVEQFLSSFVVGAQSENSGSGLPLGTGLKLRYKLITSPTGGYVFALGASIIVTSEYPVEPAL